MPPAMGLGTRLQTKIRAERLFVVGLFVIGLGLRWLFSDGDFIGDDAWYLYLSRNFGNEPAVHGEHPWFHIANRPLYYVFYHLSTYAGLTGFRLVGCFVGAALPVLSFKAARRFGSTLLSAAVASTILCLQAQQIKYSALAFPDALAAAFALGACWALAAESLMLALGLSAASVAAKESFIAIPMMIAMLHLMASRTRPRAQHWLVLACPVLYVAAVASVPLFNPSLRMQGWSTTPFKLNYARNMWVGPEVWPVIIWVLWRRNVQLLLLWLTLPLFYLAWSSMLGRGIAPWYVIGPGAIASVAVARTLDLVYDECARRKLSAVKCFTVAALCASCFAPLPLYGLSRTLVQWARLHGRLPVPSAAPAVVELIKQAHPEHLLLINCFWAYRYLHFRSGEPADAIWWYGPKDTEAVLAATAPASMVVVCSDAQRAPIERELRGLPRTQLLDDGSYMVLGTARKGH